MIARLLLGVLLSESNRDLNGRPLGRGPLELCLCGDLGSGDLNLLVNLDSLVVSRSFVSGDLNLLWASMFLLGAAAKAYLGIKSLNFRMADLILVALHFFFINYEFYFFINPQLVHATNNQYP